MKYFLWWCGVNFHLTYDNKYEFPQMGGIQQGSICDKSAFLQLMALVVSQGAISYKAERGVIYNS